MLQGPYSSLDRDRLLIRLPFKSFAVGTVLLPVTGFIACIFISLLYHYEDATYTHCKVSADGEGDASRKLLIYLSHSQLTSKNVNLGFSDSR